MKKEILSCHDFSFIPFLYSSINTFYFQLFHICFPIVFFWYIWAAGIISKPVEAPKVVSDEQLSTAEMTLRMKLLGEDRYLVFTIVLQLLWKKILFTILLMA